MGVGDITLRRLYEAGGIMDGFGPAVLPQANVASPLRGWDDRSSL